MNNRQLGKFSISRGILLDDPQSLLSVFAHVVIVKCEMDFATDRFNYVALSELFDEVETGEEIPTYSPEMLKEGDVVRFSRFIKQ